MGWEWANHRDANMGVVYTNPWQFEQGTWGMKPWGMKPLFRHTHMEPNCNGDVDILKTMKPLLPGIAEGSLKAAWMDIPSLCLQNLEALRSTAENVPKHQLSNWISVGIFVTLTQPPSSDGAMDVVEYLMQVDELGNPWGRLQMRIRIWTNQKLGRYIWLKIAL